MNVSVDAQTGQKIRASCKMFMNVWSGSGFLLFSFSITILNLNVVWSWHLPRIHVQTFILEREQSLAIFEIELTPSRATIRSLPAAGVLTPQLRKWIHF